MLKRMSGSGEGSGGGTPSSLVQAATPALVPVDTSKPSAALELHSVAPTPAPNRWWRDYVMSPWSWTRASNQAGNLPTPVKGEAGGFDVTSAALGGRRAYLKPLRRGATPAHARAAREKIASDLAHDLGVRVPPVVLYQRQGFPSGEEEFVCVSLVMHRRQWSWQLMHSRILSASADDEERKIAMLTMPKAAAQGLALDTWLQQLDHGGPDGKRGHPHNIIYGYDGAPETGEYVFLDYAFSLGFPLQPANENAWANGGWKNELFPPFPAFMLRWLDKDELEAKVSGIESYDDSAISTLVGRLPETHLAKDQQQIIIDGLIGRKKLVRKILSSHLKGAVS